MSRPDGRGLGRRGSIALMAALLALPLVGLVGLATDGARAWLLRSRLHTALDAAALAGARNINLQVAQRDAEVAGMFWTNFGVADSGFTAAQATGHAWRGFLDAMTTLDPPVAVDASTMQVSAHAVLDTTFTRVLGIPSVHVAVSAQAKRADLGMELSLVLDVTGSMDTNCSTPSDRTASSCGVTTVPREPGTTTASRNNNMDLLRLAAADLINILYGSRETVSNLWVSIVPFTTTVNLGPNRRDWLGGSAASSLDSDFSPTSWRGCVEARVGYDGAPDDGDRRDYTPSEVPFRPFLYKSTLGLYTLNGAAVPGDNDWARKLWNATTSGDNAITEDWYLYRGNYQVGPNVGCPATVVLPLTAKKTTVLDTIQSLRPSSRGGTMGNLGLQAGWFTLSPRWRGAWALGAAPAGQATALPLDYNAPYMRKVIVMMTDGTNQWYDTPYGFPGACTETTKSTASYPTSPAPGPAQAVRPIACPAANQVGSVTAASGAPAITNNADYTGYGRLKDGRLGTGVTNNSQAQTEINNRVAALCAAIKSAGITIYTVVLDTSGSSTSAATRTLYQGCATTPQHYVFVSQPTDLRTAFQQIGTQLANLRLVR
ncbi:vWA domain-containing protein [Roseicella frigidaeris]|uniref:vWA domain-containing protein n=1 Tax=Roseicella frigidaeris TaxID=2230885 RepID=UPI001402D19C|nr:vWA domain-containing protein [Roseicella frigidaeris]